MSLPASKIASFDEDSIEEYNESISENDQDSWDRSESQEEKVIKSIDYDETETVDYENTEIIDDEGDDDDDDDDDEEDEASNSSIELEYKSGIHENFRLNFISESSSKSSLRGSRNVSKKNYSFSNERLREIERHNQILLHKILTKKATYEKPCSRSDNPFTSKNLPPPPRISSAAVNRKKQQMQIDRENQILKKKIEAIARRRKRQY